MSRIGPGFLNWTQCGEEKPSASLVPFLRFSDASWLRINQNKNESKP